MKSILILISCIITSSCYAKTIETYALHKDEVNLKNFGFSYCLAKDQSLYTEASLAMGGYFQEGSYEEPAYKILKAFIDTQVEKNKHVYKDTEQPTTLMNCLSLYNSNEYNKVIIEQKNYRIE